MGDGISADVGDVIGDYHLDDVLGRGGMGCVFAATHQRIHRRVALKLLSNELAASEEYVSRFLYEARIVNDVRHPNIVDITDFIELETPRRVAYVMEYIEGPSLGALLKQQPLSLEQSVNLALQLVSALQAVHALGVTHRDLKPDNILVIAPLDSDFSASPCAKILDFGIAKVSDANASHKTATGLMLGTPAYMAPEQIAAEPVSAATDIYALGEILYEMVSGKRLFAGDQMNLLRAKLIGEVPTLEMPTGMHGADHARSLVTRCLKLNPSERPTLHDFAEGLTEILSISNSAPSLAARSVAASARTPTPGPHQVSGAMEQPTPYSMVSMVAEASPRSKSPLWFGLLALGLGLVLFAFFLVDRMREPEVVTLAEIAPTPKPASDPSTAQPEPTRRPTPAPESAAALTQDVDESRAKEPATEPAKEPVKKVVKKTLRKVVTVRSRPPKARVVDIDSGRALGTAPVRLRLDGPDDRRRLRLELAGHRSSEVLVDGKRRRLTVRMRAKSKPEPKPKPKGPIKRSALPEW